MFRYIYSFWSRLLDVFFFDGERLLEIEYSDSWGYYSHIVLNHHNDDLINILVVSSLLALIFGLFYQVYRLLKSLGGGYSDAL